MPFVKEDKKLLPYPMTIMVWIMAINSSDYKDIFKAKLIADLTETTTILAPHLDDVKRTFDDKIAEVRADRKSQHAAGIYHQLIRGLRGVQYQIEHRANRARARSVEDIDRVANETAH